jgi:polyphosphate glucokinase
MKPKTIAKIAATTPPEEAPAKASAKAITKAVSKGITKGTAKAITNGKRVLVLDVGGTHVKMLASGQTVEREFLSGPKLTPRQMVRRVKALTRDWRYDVVSMGFPGAVLHGAIAIEPANLGRGWVGFDFRRAFGRPVKIINDAAMQALGSYRGGRMLFLGFGTGLGTALIIDGVVEPMELAHLPYKKATYEDYVGLRGLRRHGKKKWRRQVFDVATRLFAALEADDLVLGGGNNRLIKRLPPAARLGDNANAFKGGIRLWVPPRARRAGK